MTNPKDNITRNINTILFFIIAISIFIIASVLIVPIENRTSPAVSLSVFSVLTSAGIALLAYANEKRIGEKSGGKSTKEPSENRSKRHYILFASVAFIMSLVFFFIGFCFRIWYVAWVAFPICGIIIMLIKKQIRNNNA